MYRLLPPLSFRFFSSPGGGGGVSLGLALSPKHCLSSSQHSSPARSSLTPESITPSGTPRRRKPPEPLAGYLLKRSSGKELVFHRRYFEVREGLLLKKHLVMTAFVALTLSAVPVWQVDASCGVLSYWVKKPETDKQRRAKG